MSNGSAEEHRALKRFRKTEQLIAPGRRPLDLRDLLIAVLTCPLLDEIPRGGGKTLTERDVEWFKSEARAYLNKARSRIMDRQGGDLGWWLETYWFPVTPRSERLEACQWTDLERGSLPDQVRMPVTTVCMYVAHDVHASPLRAVQRAMRDIAREGTRLKSTRRSSSSGSERPGSRLGQEMLTSHGVGWHHGGE